MDRALTRLNATKTCKSKIPRFANKKTANVDD